MAAEAPALERPAPEDGATLLDNLAAFVRRFVVITDAQAAVIALWIVHTHALDAAEATPYLAITSAEKRSGKTRLLEVLTLLVARPLATSNISDAALFRSIANDRPTLLFDEIDAIFGPKARDREDLRGMINAGHRRGAEVRRVGGANRDKLERFAAESIEALEAARPELPGDLDDRAQDGAEPLLAIADLAGGEWAQRARHAIVELRGGATAEDDSIGVRLLADVRGAFETLAADRVSTADLLAHLHGLDEAPWPEWYGKPLTSRALSKLLTPYGLSSRTVRLDDGSTPKGYKREQFDDAWKRYLPATGASIRHNATTRIGSGIATRTDPPQDRVVADSEEAENPHGERDVADVADRGAGDGAERPITADESVIPFAPDDLENGWSPEAAEAFIARAREVFPGSYELPRNGARQ